MGEASSLSLNLMEILKQLHDSLFIEHDGVVFDDTC